MKKKVEALNVLKPVEQKLTIKDTIPYNQLSEEAKNEVGKVKKIEKILNRENLVYKTDNYTYSFQKFETIRSFAKTIINSKVNLNDADEDQSILLTEIMNCRKTARPRKLEKQEPKKAYMS